MYIVLRNNRKLILKLFESPVHL